MRNVIRFMVIIIAIGLSSCVEKVDFDGEKMQATIDNMISTAEFVVPTKAGYTTSVAYGGVVIASTSKPMTILVPKQAVSGSRSASQSLSVFYQDGETDKSSSVLWQTVMFEDSPYGDADYNDLIFNTQYKTIDNKMQVSVCPIALGSTKPIKLGFRWTQGGSSGEVIVCENARDELFDGKKDFINTMNYDIHYGTFKKSIEIPTSGISSPVNIWWFIVVDTNTEIFAVNSIGQRSFDINGMPYGFAITDTGNRNTSAVSRAATRADYSDKTWAQTIMPIDHVSWSYVPDLPTIPANAVSMDNYQAWESNKINRIESGKTFSGQLQYVSGFELYVEGTLNLSDKNYGNGPATIYVMPNGVLNVSSSIDGVTIINYGEVNFKSNLYVQRATIRSQKELNLANYTLQVGTNGKLYTGKKLSARSVSINNDGYIYANSVDLEGDFNISNTGKAFVETELECENMELSSSSHCYVGCKLDVEEKLKIGNTSVLSVKGSAEVSVLECSNSILVNINNGGLLEVDEMNISNTSSCKFRIIGSDPGMIEAEEITLSGGLNLSNTFGGNMFLTFEELYEGKKEIDLGNSRLTLPPASVKINSPDAHVPDTECSPGHNSGGSGSGSSNAPSWFSFPLESVNINTCYDFSSWLQGRYDFTLRPGAKVFDITQTNPCEGAQMSIYQMK